MSVTRTWLGPGYAKTRAGPGYADGFVRNPDLRNPDLAKSGLGTWSTKRSGLSTRLEVCAGRPTLAECKLTVYAQTDGVHACNAQAYCAGLELY